MTEKDMLNQKKLITHTSIKAVRLANIPRIIFPAALPITAKKNEIIEAIIQNRVIIITGETGSGKTTQIPKICIEAGRGITGIIGCTQPRRVAAITVAHRIAYELGEEIGRSVGYRVRFADRTGQNNYIKIMTDGILLNEMQNDPYLRRYDTIIVDEAHERSLNIDFILGALRILLQKRKDLKVIITSATIDTQKFSRAFEAPIIEVSGRMYPVDVLYRPIEQDLEEKEGLSHVDAAVDALKMLLKETYEGDILIFMPTEQDIRDTCDLIGDLPSYEGTILPLFARLPWTEQRRVFQHASSRRIVVATNIAETSVTIPGIRYVIDTGLARILQYNPRSRTTSLPVMPISKSSADQRKGRCGRVRNGVCIRLYRKDDYEQRPIFTEPEILRSNLAEVVLRMLYLNLGTVTSFPFIDSPFPKNIRDAIEILKELGAIETLIEGNNADNTQKFVLTEHGKVMAQFPMDPRISRMIIEAKKERCTEEILVIAAALSIHDPREKPSGFEKEADKVHTNFIDPQSDFMTLLRIWNQYQGVLHNAKSKSHMKRFCREHFLSFRRMKEWIDVHDQLHEILDEQGWRIRNKMDLNDPSRYDGIHKSILSGYLSNVATKKEKNFYNAAKGKEIMLFPGSGLFNRGGSWIVAAEIVETSRLFARTSANVNSEWLEDIGGKLCRSTYFEPRWSRNRGEVIAYEQVSLFGLVIVPKRLVSYGRINPEEASEIFVRSALVNGDVKKPPYFLMYNKSVIVKITNMEEKIRRRNLLASDDKLAQFYLARIPLIYDLRTLQKMIKDRGSDDFLRMKEEDILQRFPPEDVTDLYPDSVSIGGNRLCCTYRFNPGKTDDGVTLRVPIDMTGVIPAKFADRLVPGLLEGKITSLLKGLPKDLRKKLPPISDICDAILSDLDKIDDSLSSVMSQVIYERFGLSIPASLWNIDVVSDHLKIRYEIVDEKGKEISSGRDILALQKGIAAATASSVFIHAQNIYEKRGLKAWNFGDLPDKILLGKDSDQCVYAYPALEEGDGYVNIRLFRNPLEAELSHRKGVLALYAILFNNNLKHLRKSLVFKGDMEELTDALGETKAFENKMFQRVLLDLFDLPIRTQDEFERHAEETASQILPAGQAVINRFYPLIKGYHDIMLKLRSLEKINRSNRPALRYLEEIKNDLRLLIPPEFILIYHDEKIPDIIRYLKAMSLRAERGLMHLEKAFQKTEEIKTFSHRYQVVINSFSPDTPDKTRAAVEEFRWMIEEYKVSVFAQEIRTAFTVSQKRLEKKLEEIERVT